MDPLEHQRKGLPELMDSAKKSTFWKSNYSKFTRQNFIVSIFSNRVNIALSEYIFTLKSC